MEETREAIIDVYLVDNSSSMKDSLSPGPLKWIVGESKFSMAKKALNALLTKQMKEEQQNVYKINSRFIGLVVFNDDVVVSKDIRPATVEYLEEILEEINRIELASYRVGTDAWKAVNHTYKNLLPALQYELREAKCMVSGISQVHLFTDGLNTVERPWRDYSEVKSLLDTMRAEPWVIWSFEMNVFYLTSDPEEYQRASVAAQPDENWVTFHRPTSSADIVQKKQRQDEHTYKSHSLMFQKELQQRALEAQARRQRAQSDPAPHSEPAHDPDNRIYRHPITAYSASKRELQQHEQQQSELAAHIAEFNEARRKRSDAAAHRPAPAVPSPRLPEQS